MVPLCVMAPTCGNLSLGRGPPAGVGVACVPGGRPPGGDCMIGKDVPLRDMVEALELAYEQHLRARRKAKQAGGEAGLGWASGGGVLGPKQRLHPAPFDGQSAVPKFFPILNGANTLDIPK